jgi:hypothetical protein
MYRATYRELAAPGSQEPVQVPERLSREISARADRKKYMPPEARSFSAKRFTMRGIPLSFVA